MSSTYPREHPKLGFNEVGSVTLAAGQEGTITFTPTGRSSRHYAEQIAADKEPDTIYRVEVDGQVVFGDHSMPPTDIDDAAPTFRPAKRFDRELVVVITNTGASTRTYRVNLVGWEVRRLVDEGGL